MRGYIVRVEDTFFKVRERTRVLDRTVVYVCMGPLGRRERRDDKVTKH